MINRPISNHTIKYSVLKPNPLINDMKRNFEVSEYPNQYQIQLNGQVAIRRYKQTVEHLEKLLTDCQWRHQQTSPIIRCHYVQLLNGVEHKKIPVELFVDHFELTLAELKKMLLPEAVYMIVRAFQGYKALWGRYFQVSVNEQTIGLDRKGNCLVWLNRSLQSNHSEACKLNCPNKIMKEIVYAIKSKSEPVCYDHLLKLLDALQKTTTFQEGAYIVHGFSMNLKIRIPNNLNYLVSQYRLEKKISLLNFKCSFKESKNGLFGMKKANFVNSRRNLIQDTNSIVKQKGKIFSTLRKTTSPPISLLTYRSKDNIGANLYAKNGENGSDYHNSSFTSRIRKANISSHSRSRSDYLDCIQIISNFRPLTQKIFGTMRSIDNMVQDKYSSAFSGNTKTAESQTSIQSINKINLSNQRVSKKTIESLNQGQEFQSVECSPFIIREEQSKPNNKRSSLEESDHFQQVRESQIIRANNWTKTLGNILEAQVNLNTSVTIGKDIKNRLKQIRLQKLDFIHNNLAQSIQT